MIKRLTSIVCRGEELYVAHCPELDVASQGLTIVEARENLREAVELFLECADPSEIDTRLNRETDVSLLEVSIG